MGTWEIETGRSWGLASLVDIQVNNNRVCLRQGRKGGLTLEVALSTPHPTHTNTHIKIMIMMMVVVVLVVVVVFE